MNYSNSRTLNNSGSSIFALGANAADAAEYSGIERRIEARHQIKLKSPVLMMAVKTIDPKNEEYLVVRGRLLNVSFSGIAVAIPHEELHEMRRFESNPILRLMLPLPTESVELEALPVRCRLISDTEVLIGAQITSMNGRDRIIFMKFLNQLVEIG